MNRDVYGYIALFGLIGSIVLFAAILFWGVNNDYVVYEMNNLTQEIGQSGIISQEIVDSVDTTAEQHSIMGNYFDMYWLLFYLMFVGGTITASYFAKSEDEFSFLGMLFYGTMLFLFVFFLASVLTDWITTEILYKIMPAIEGSMPKFEFWTEWSGLFTLTHILVCMFANRLDLGKVFKKRDELAMGDPSEVL